ncbi:MAG: PQQ-binding-like beta-propeller repeat protein [candidate division Zixibacteria bacterium]|nr:PQQ-binding-like beta-propeller repeat protein [candidate division Zixibacteria bacterium]
MIWRRILIYALLFVAVACFLACSSGIKAVKHFQYQPDGWDMFRDNPAGVADSNISLRNINALIWSRKSKGQIYASPVINDGLGVIPALDRRIYLFDPATGDGIGKIKMNSSSSSSPALAENLLYVASEAGDGRLRCINITRGMEVWAMELGDVSAPIILHDRTLFVGNYGGDFYSINRFTGDVNWTHRTGGLIRGGAAVADGRVYVGSTDGYLYCLDIDSGDVAWKFRAESAIFTTPALSNLCFVTTFDGLLFALDPASGDEVWRFQTEGNVFSSPVADGEAVYFGSNDGNLYSLSSRDGFVLWRFQTESIVTATPLVSSDAVVIGSSDANVYFIDKGTGREFFSYTTSSRIESSPVYYDGMVFIASADRHLYCFGQSGTAMSARIAP